MNDPFQKQTYQPNNFETRLCPYCNFPNRVTDTYCKYCEIPLQQQDLRISRRLRLFLRRVPNAFGNLGERRRLERLKGKVYWVIGLGFLALTLYLLL